MSDVEKMVDKWCCCKEQIAKNLHKIATIKAEATARTLPIGQENVKLGSEIKSLEKDIFLYLKENGIYEEDTRRYKAKLEINYSLKMKPVINKV